MKPLNGLTKAQALAWLEEVKKPTSAASPAKTAAQRQAERKARELAAGRVQWKRWVHPDDVPALAEYADKMARRRERAAKKAA